MSKHNAFRDGRVHVLANQCSTCIFGRNRIRGLAPGRVAGMVLDARRNESAIICHATLTDGHDNAVCRGFYDLPRPTMPLQVAERLGMITFVTDPSHT